MEHTEQEVINEVIRKFEAGWSCNINDFQILVNEIKWLRQENAGLALKYGRAKSDKRKMSRTIKE